MDATRLLAAATLGFFTLLLACGIAKAQVDPQFERPDYNQEGSSRYAENRFGSGTLTPGFDTRTSAQQAPSGGIPAQRQRAEPQVSTQFHGEPNFLIPFDLAAQAESIGEVHLYVSAQQGRDWVAYAKQPPTAKEFRFQSLGDGEYWFAVRTTDRNGRLTAPVPVQPELKVIVDTQKPQLDLRVDSDSSGKVVAEWLAEDPHLLSHTFRLLYLDHLGEWRQVAVRAPREDNRRQQWQGNVRFSLPNGLEQVEFVAEVADEAENISRIRKQVALRGAGFGSSPATSPQTAVQQPRAQQPRTQQTGGNAGGWNDFAAGMNRWLGGVQHPDNQSHGARRQVNPVSANTSISQRRVPLQSPQSPVGQQRAGFQPPSALENGYASNPNEYASGASWTQRPRITSSPNFEIDYQLQGIDRRGPRTVELWITQDRGRSWELYGADGDKQSPMEVRLTKEGIFGFRLLVHGFDSPPPTAPQSNEPADIWVAADWTKPVGRITRARLNEGNQGDGLHGSGRELIIDWVAEDALLEDQPITIQYAAASDGPWYPVATGIRNSGTYRWQLDRQLPTTLFLQLQVRDIAGNVTANVFDATASQFGPPAAKIIDIRPMGRSALVPVQPSGRF